MKTINWSSPLRVIGHPEFVNIRVVCDMKNVNFDFKAKIVIAEVDGRFPVEERLFVVSEETGNTFGGYQFENSPEREVRFVNVYTNLLGNRYFSCLSEANIQQGFGRCGVLKLTFEDNVLIGSEMVNQ